MSRAITVDCGENHAKTTFRRRLDAARAISQIGKIEQTMITISHTHELFARNYNSASYTRKHYC